MLEEEEKALALAAALVTGHSAQLPLGSPQQVEFAAKVAVFTYNRVLFNVRNGVTDMD